MIRLRSKHGISNRLIYYRKLTGITLFLALIILLLSVKLYASGPRVRIVNINTQAQLTRGSVIRLTFDRPLYQSDFTSSISISPGVPIETAVDGKNLIVTLKANLSQDTEYVLTVKPEIADRAQHKMSKEYKTTFHTSVARYVYLQRKYADRVAATEKPEDVIYLGDIAGQKTELFSAGKIRLMRANGKSVVVVVDEGETDGLYSIDLLTRQVSHQALMTKGRVSDMALSPQGSVALVSVQPDYDPNNPNYFNENAYKLQAFDSIKGKVYEITNTDGSPLQADSIMFNTDGQYALVRDMKRSFLVISPYNDFAPVLLGKHTRAHGFDAESKEIIFEDNGKLSSYALDSAQSTEHSIQDIVLNVTQSKGDIFMQVAEYDDGLFITKIKRSPSWDAPFSAVWEPTASTAKSLVRSFEESYDQRYIAVQIDSENCQFDDYDIASECKDVTTTLFDTEEKKEMQKIDGFGFIWLP